MRILVTGGAGFVGSHLRAALTQRLGADAGIIMTGKPGTMRDAAPLFPLDVTDAEAVADTIRRYAPTHVVHLAALSSLPAADADPDLAWRINLTGTLNVARAILRHAPDCLLLHVSSGQVYGATARTAELLTEAAVLAPVNDYAATKAAADLALGAMAANGLRCVRLRPFNHIGPEQAGDFAVSGFARQIARIERGLQQGIIEVGNLDAERDFLDVRDVCRAYCEVIARADTIPAGAIYNIASGIPRRIGDLLARLLAMSAPPITVRPVAARLRPTDLPRMVGDATRAARELGWRPAIGLDDTLEDVLAFARDTAARAS